MLPEFILYLLAALAALLAALGLFLHRGRQWGSSAEERDLKLPGDTHLDGGPRCRVVMTRAISVAAPPETVWPWVAQLGRGAGWYSYDWLDNGGKTSAQHIVTWIPEPRLGDASPIGYLSHMEPGRSLVWWLSGLTYAGAGTRLVVDFYLKRQGNGSRLVARMSGDAHGLAARPALLLFQFLDSIMAIRMLRGIRERVQRYGARSENPSDPETGSIEQYQLYESLFAGGGRAGVRGKELAARWRQSAIDDGIIAPE